MKKLILTAFFLTVAASVTAAAKSPDICKVIEDQDGFSVTIKNAAECYKATTDGHYDTEAYKVCLAIVQVDSYPSTQRNAIKCLSTIKNKSFKESTTKCLGIATKDSFASTQAGAIKCLDKISVPMVVEANGRPVPLPKLPEPPPSLKPVNSENKTESVGSAGVFTSRCPKNKDCWSKAIKELQTKYKCHIISDTAVMPQSGETIFAISSLDCKILGVSADAELCPSGSQAQGVDNIVKICIPQKQESGKSAAENAVK